MPIFNCKRCNKEHKSKHSKAKYCSSKCSNLDNINHRNNPPVYSKKELIKKLIEYKKRTGLNPSKSRADDPKTDLPCYETYKKRFGSFTNALVEAGLEPNIARPNISSEISVSVRFKVLKRDKFTCVYCGGKPSQGYTLHVDHIIPKSKGGSNELNNLVTACEICNIGKSNK